MKVIMTIIGFVIGFNLFIDIVTYLVVYDEIFNQNEYIFLTKKQVSKIRHSKRLRLKVIDRSLPILFYDNLLIKLDFISKYKLLIYFFFNRQELISNEAREKGLQYIEETMREDENNNA